MVSARLLAAWACNVTLLWHVIDEHGLQHVVYLMTVLQGRLRTMGPGFLSVARLDFCHCAVKSTILRRIGVLHLQLGLERCASDQVKTQGCYSRLLFAISVLPAYATTLGSVQDHRVHLLPSRQLCLDHGPLPRPYHESRRNAKEKSKLLGAGGSASQVYGLAK